MRTCGSLGDERQMADPQADDAGLAMLLVDVLAGDDQEIEDLLIYARDPEGLARDRRLRLESRLRESPALADQLRVLKRLGPLEDPSATSGLD